MTSSQQNKPQHHSVSISTFITLLCTFFMLVASAFWLFFLDSGLSRIIENQQQEYQQRLVEPLRNQIGEWVMTDNRISLNLALKELVNGPWIIEAEIRRADRQLLAQQKKINAPDRLLNEISYELNLDGQYLGQMILWIDPEPEMLALNKIWNSFIFSSLMLLALVAFISRMIGQKLGSKVVELEQQVQQLDLGKIETAEQLNSHIIELQNLQLAIQNQLKRKSEQNQVQSALSNFIAPNVVDGLGMPFESAALPDKYVHGAVLFIELANVQKVQQALEPAELSALLNRYYFLINQAAKLYNGQVDRYVGQGLMLLFGVPQADEKDSFHGVCAGMLILGMLGKFNAERAKQGLPTLKFRLGLHAGMVLAGAFGDGEKLNFSVVGDEVNLAARLSRTSPDGQLLISEVILESSGIAEQIEFRHAGPIQHGDDQINTFIVKNLKENYGQLVERQVNHILSSELSL